VAIQLGIDPVHLGVVFIVNLEIGYLTPPIGINLFVASLAFRESIGEVIKGVLPFIGLMAIGLGIVTYVPSVALGPVNVFMRDKPFYEAFPDPPEAKPVLADDIDDDDEDDDEDDDDVVKPPSADTNRVLSIEEMMALDGGDEDEDEDDEDEDEAAPGRVLSIEEMMKQADKEEADADEDEAEPEKAPVPDRVLSIEEMMEQADKKEAD
jgi:C4-dicarboxylate transporter DctM subunit